MTRLQIAISAIAAATFLGERASCQSVFRDVAREDRALHSGKGASGKGRGSIKASSSSSSSSASLGKGGGSSSLRSSNNRSGKGKGSDKISSVPGCGGEGHRCGVAHLKCCHGLECVVEHEWGGSMECAYPPPAVVDSSSPTDSPTSSPTSLPTSTSGPTSSPTSSPTICGTTLTEDTVLDDDLECAVSNSGGDCDSSSICLDVGASLDCNGKTISKAASASIADGFRMLTDSTLVNCTVVGFGDDGIQVVKDATGVLIENVFTNSNNYGVFADGGSSVTLKNVVANNNNVYGLNLGSNVTFDGIEACQNGRFDIKSGEGTFVSGSGATYNTCRDATNFDGSICPTPKMNCSTPP